MPFSKVTPGDIITLVLIAIGAFTWAVKLEGRVTYIDENGTKAVRVLTGEIQALRLEMAELRATIN
jgi:nitrogen fixation-related uncharacterized protein